MNHEYFKSFLKNELFPNEYSLMIKCLENMKKFEVSV